MPYLGYIGMGRCEGYGFQAGYCWIGYINQTVWVQNRISFSRKLINWLKILFQSRGTGNCHSNHKKIKSVLFFFFFSKRSYFKSVLHVYTLSKILLWIKPSYFSLENACYSWCMHQTGCFFVAQRRLLCHKVNLLSCVARRPQCHRVNLSSCVARRPLFHKVNLPRCKARRHHFIMTCDIFGTGTNEHFSSMLFIRKNVTSPQQRHSSH